MKSNSLVLTNGIVGLIGGILVLLGPFLILISSFTDLVSGSSESMTINAIIVLTILKLVLLGLGITAFIKYKKNEAVMVSAHILFIVGPAVSLIPFLGWVGGVVTIVGAALYLASLKNFKREKIETEKTLPEAI
ncbi:MAG: hypothetical protein ACI31W_08795 [Lactococcus sp.]